MSPTGPYYAGTVVDGAQGGGVAWTNVAQAAGAPNGLYATNTSTLTNYLKATNYGFNLPSTAVIDGIQVDIDRFITGATATDASVMIVKGGVISGTSQSSGASWPSTLTFASYGGSTNLWGVSWTAADINNAGFGVALQANTSGTGTANVDAIRITVYWHTAPADVPKRYIYQAFNNTGQYLGNLPNVISDFGFPWEMNTAGSQITIECAVSADTAYLPVDSLTDESGNPLTDESGNSLTDEGQLPIVSPGSSGINTLIKNGNFVKVYEYGYWHPNGVCVFQGQMQNNAATYGGKDGDTVRVLCYSDGSDLANLIVLAGTYTVDQSQITQNASVTVSNSGGMPAVYTSYGQTFVPSNSTLTSISLYMSGTANVTISLYSFFGGSLIGTATKAVNVSTPSEVQFIFPSEVTGVINTTFFSVSVGAGQSITLYYSNANPYASGSMYTSSNASPSWTAQSGNDLYFKTAYGGNSTTGTYSNQDPSTGMLEPVLDNYNARGGRIQYTSSSIQATGLSLSYEFNTQTVLEGIQAMRSISPNGFYWYVDVGTDTLYFKQASTTADVVLTKGRHLNAITLVQTIENIKNTAYVTGGIPTGSSTNIYVQRSNSASVTLYGPRLDRLSDPHILDTPTAAQVAVADILSNKDEQYQTTVTIVDKTMDTTTLKPGMVVGFNGFGTFVDSLLSQIVRIDYAPDEVTLTLGIMPKRLHQEFDRITRGLVAMQTISNPTTPS